MDSRTPALLLCLGLTACVQPQTDCANIARWIELGAATRMTPPADGSRDDEYAAAIAARLEVKEQLDEHEMRFAKSLEEKLNEPAEGDYAAIYAVCRQWETGNYR